MTHQIEMKRVKVKAYQSKPTQASASVKPERRGHCCDNQDQFFGFPMERLVTEKIVPRPTKRHFNDPTRTSNLDTSNRTLRNKSSWSQDDQYPTHLVHMNSEKVSVKKNTESSRIAEDSTPCTPVTCKRTWLRQVKAPKPITSVVNRKHSFSPRRTDVTTKENNAFECDRRGIKIVPHRFSNSECMAACRNVLGVHVKDEKNLSSECLNVHSLLENQIKSVPSQSWSVNADAIPSLRRSSTTIFSHKTCLKPTDACSFPNREAGDLSSWMVEGLDVTKAGRPNIGYQKKKHLENNHPLYDSSESKSSNVVIHQNIKRKVLTHRKVSSTMSKPRYKPKQKKDQARLHDSTESQPLSNGIQYWSQLNRYKHDAKHEDTDLSMIPMKDSDSKESLMSGFSDDSDKVVNMLSKCSTANTWDPYNAIAKEDMMKCSNELCSEYLVNFDPSLNHSEDTPGQNVSKSQVKSGDLEPFMRIRLKSSRVDAAPVQPRLTSKENLNSLTDSGDWSKFTPVCHIYNGSAPSKFSSANVGSRCEEDSIKVINIDDPTFLKASETAVISELKDTTSTWMTGHLETHSRVSFTSSVVEEQTLESKKDDMPSGFRVNANRITLHVESMGMRLQRNNKTDMQSKNEQSRAMIRNELESADRGQLYISSSSDDVSEIIRTGPKITYSLNKQEDRINSSTFNKRNWRSEHISTMEKNIVKVVPPKSKLTQLNAANARDSFIKRTVFQKRKPHRRNIFGKTITNRHKGFKDPSKLLRNCVIPKQEKFSSRFSPIRKTRKTNHGVTHTDTAKSTFTRGADTPANTKTPNKERGLHSYTFSPSRVPTEPVVDDQHALVSSAEIQRRTHDFQRSASYPPAIKENQKMVNDEIPVMEQGIHKAETVVLTVTNVQTSTTNFSERCTCSQGEAANRQFGQRFRIRVFVKPPKKRPARPLDQEVNVALPVTFGENEKAPDAIKCETARASKSVGELSNKSSGAETSSTQFQSLQDFLSASCSKNDLAGIVCKDKHTRDHGSGKGFESPSKPLRVTASDSGAAQATKESPTVWENAVSPSPKNRKIKSSHTKAPCLPRYPRRCERRQKSGSSWDQVNSEITPIVRPLILVMFFLCVVYLTLMTAFSIHTIQKY